MRVSRTSAFHFIAEDNSHDKEENKQADEESQQQKRTRKKMNWRRHSETKQRQSAQREQTKTVTQLCFRDLTRVPLLLLPPKSMMRRCEGAVAVRKETNTRDNHDKGKKTNKRTAKLSDIDKNIQNARQSTPLTLRRNHTATAFRCPSSALPFSLPTELPWKQQTVQSHRSLPEQVALATASPSAAFRTLGLSL